MGGITAALIALSSAYGGLGGVVERIGKVFADAWDIAKKLFDALGGSEVIDYCKEAFGRLGSALKGVYDALAALKPI